MESTHPQTNGGRLLKRGDTFDPECHRMTHRLGVARRLLALEAPGYPQYVEHAENCILHPDNAWNRCHGWTYSCDAGCPRKANPDPIWPEYFTGAMFDLAFKLADEFQTRRGDWHQMKINEERRQREARANPLVRQAMEAEFPDLRDRDEFGHGLGEIAGAVDEASGEVFSDADPGL